MRKRLRYAGIVVAVAAMGFFVTERIVLVAIVETALKYVVAMDTRINSVRLNPFTGCVTIKGFQIYNPPAFKERLLADVRSIIADFKAKTLSEDGLFFDRIALDIKSINVIKKKEDGTNISQMKAFTPQEKQKDKQKDKPPFLADRYDVRIEKIKVTDHTKGGDPEVREIDLGLSESYKKVWNPDTVIKAIGFKLYFNAKLHGIGFNIQKIKQELERLAKENKKLAEELREAAQEKKEGTEEPAGDMLGATKEAIKDTAEGIKTKAAEATKAISEQTEKAHDAVKAAIQNVREQVGQTEKVVEENGEDVKITVKGEGEVGNE